MTAVISPDGAEALARQLGERPPGRPLGQIRHLDAVEQLEADRVADRLRPVCMPVSPLATPGSDRPDLVVGGEHAVAVGDQDPPATVRVAPDT